MVIYFCHLYMTSSSSIYPDHDSLSTTYYGYSFLNRVRGVVRYFVPSTGDFEASQIDENVWIGSNVASYDKASLKAHNITHIVSILAGYNPPFPDDFEYMVIHALDTPGVRLEPVFTRCFDFIKQAVDKNEGVLIHCMAGRSRSATIGASYLMKRHGLRVEDAIDRIKSIRSTVNPNLGFVEQLKKINIDTPYIDLENPVIPPIPANPVREIPLNVGRGPRLVEIEKNKKKKDRNMRHQTLKHQKRMKRLMKRQNIQ